MMHKGMLHCPAEGFLDTNNTQADELMPRLVNLRVVSGGWNIKKIEMSVKDQLHSFIHMLLKPQ